MSNYANYEIKVFLLLRNLKGELLMTKNDHKDSIIYGYVNPPGGHLEIGESVTQATLRETVEETGITKLTNIQIKGVINVFGFKDLPVLMFVVSATVPSGQKPVSKDEGTLIWVKTKQLSKYKVLEDVEKIIRLADKTSPGKIFQVISTFAHRKLVSFKKS